MTWRRRTRVTDPPDVKARWEAIVRRQHRAHIAALKRKQARLSS